MKAKLTTGTSGVATGLAEYQLNLDVSQMLQQELLNPWLSGCDDSYNK